MEGGGLVDDPLVGLGGPAEHQDGGLLGADEVEQRPAPLVDIAGGLLGEVGHHGGRLLRVPGQLDGELGLQIGRSDDDDPIPLLERRPSPPGHGRHGVEPRHQEQGGPKTTKRGSSESPTNSCTSEMPSAPAPEAMREVGNRLRSVLGTSGSPNP